MGNGRWNEAAWRRYSDQEVRGRSRAEIFGARRMNPAYDPSQFAFRESRDSADNPHSTPILLASDVTGSMGMIAEVVLREGLNTLATEIYARCPVSDPHIAIAAVGDANYDRAPLQVTQFEADIRVAEQARELWLEGGGGGNGGETYSAAHLLAATKVRADAFDKGRRKGYLFTIGDEPNLNGLTADQVERVLGVRPTRDLTARDCLNVALRDWDVFHVVLSSEGFARRSLDSVLATWRPLLGGRVVCLDDVRALAETIVSLIAVNEGAARDDVAASWGSRSGTVAAAIGATRPGGLIGWFR